MASSYIETIGLCFLEFHIENCPLRLGRLGAPHFIVVPLYIAETNQPRK